MSNAEHITETRLEEDSLASPTTPKATGPKKGDPLLPESEDRTFKSSSAPHTPATSTAATVPKANFKRCNCPSPKDPYPEVNNLPDYKGETLEAELPTSTKIDTGSEHRLPRPAAKAQEKPALHVDVDSKPKGIPDFIKEILKSPTSPQHFFDINDRIHAPENEKRQRHEAADEKMSDSKTLQMDSRPSISGSEGGLGEQSMTGGMRIRSPQRNLRHAF